MIREILFDCVFTLVWYVLENILFSYHNLNSKQNLLLNHFLRWDQNVFLLTIRVHNTCINTIDDRKRSGENFNPHLSVFDLTK